MKIRKTRQDRRETYRYEAYLENDNGEYTKECIELKPGTDGVTDIVNIGLHFFLKNVRPYAASCSEA